MANKPLDDEMFPMPNEPQFVGAEISMDEVNKIALRRGKVRELTRMGYQPYQIVLILDKGIRINKTDIVKVPVSEIIIKSDVEYIRQEDAAVSVDFAEKRASLLDKLNFLYQRSVLEYTNASLGSKNSFLNTALGVLSKIIEVEGIKSSEILDVNLYAENKTAKFAEEIQTLKKEDKDALISTINSILENRKREAVEGHIVSDIAPGIPTPTSDDAGISR